MHAEPSEGRTQGSKLLAAAYFLHLVLPALLLADVLIAWRKGAIGLQLRSPDAVVAGFSVLWLVAGTALWLAFRNQQGFRSRIAKVLIVVYTIYGGLLLMEAGLSFLCPEAAAGLQPPGAKLVFTIYPDHFPGLHGTRTWSINALGIRGPMPPKAGAAYRILTVGGSTTACTMLGDAEEWPHLLMEDLNNGRQDRPVWVGNAGLNGTNAVDHLALMQSLPGLIPSDLTIFMVGINDLATTLAYQGGPTQSVLERSAGLRKDLPPGAMEKSQLPIYQHLRITLLVRSAAKNLAAKLVHSGRQNVTSRREAERPNAGIAVLGGREIEGSERRAAAPVAPLPDLQTGLKEYRSRIVALGNRCRSLGLRCLFLTQPYLYRADLSASDQRLLWFGWVGFWEHPKGFVSAADMARAMDAYNQALLDACRQNGLECYDLARNIPKDTSAFFDDVHFNEGGARLVAQSLAQYLLSKPPFR
jgi:lysophospholipase L1-like esterase